MSARLAKRMHMMAGTAVLAIVAASCTQATDAGAQAETTVAQADATQSADAALEAIYNEEWAWRQNLYWDADSATTPAHLPRVSAQAQQEKLEYWEDVQARLRAIDTDQLSQSAKLDYAVYVDQIDNLVQSVRFREYEMPLNSAGGFWTGLNYLTSNNLLNEEDYRNYIRLLEDVPNYFGDQMDNMRAGLERGFTQPRIALEGRDASIAAVADLDSAEETDFYTPFETMPESMPEALREELRQEARRVIDEDVLPSFRSLLDFFRNEYYPGARESLAAYDMPGGEAYYDWTVRKFTTRDMTPDEVHEVGLREVAEIRAEMLDIMAEVEFEGELSDFLTFLRTDPQFYAETPREYLQEAAWDSKQFDAVVSRFFGHLPRTRFGIQPFPDSIAPFTTGAAGGRQTYWLNTYNLDTRPLYSLAALTLHESAPGHSFQMSLAAENEDLPDFRREVYISAYGEGWALYCERLGVEVDMYETPYEVFGMLSYQMWRAARLVVDTGLHAKGWSRDRAIQFLIDNTAIGEHEIHTEVDRYITNPGQAVSYYTGQLAIEAARARAEEALGADFDIRAFHDTVLSLGSVPLPVLDQRIDRFIAEGGPSPYPDES